MGGGAAVEASRQWRASEREARVDKVEGGGELRRGAMPSPGEGCVGSGVAESRGEADEQVERRHLVQRRAGRHRAEAEEDEGAHADEDGVRPQPAEHRAE